MIRRTKKQKTHEEITAEYSFTVVFEPAHEGGYVVTCPALPGLVTEGDTLKKARAMAAHAVRAYIASLRKDRAEIPSDIASEPVKERISISIPV